VPGTDAASAPFADEAEKIAWLQGVGFTTTPLRVCASAEEVVAYREEVAALRETIAYDIDGLVIKERKIDPVDMQRARPDRQIAFKFELERAESVVRGVEWSESGATYTPIALFDPVRLGGTVVKRASLVNPDLIRKLGVQIGSTVVVTKRGEIIPKIESVVRGGEQEIVFPTTCGSGGATLVDEGTRLLCPNAGCPKRIHHRIEKWVGVMDLRDVGEVLLRGLFDAGRVNAITDLYTLTEEELTPYFLEEASLAKEKSSKGAAKVYAVLQTPKRVSLAQFVAGFDIENIGELLVERLTDAGFDTLEKLWAAATEELAAVKGFGAISAQALKAGLTENRAEMEKLVAEGRVVIRPPTALSGAKLAGLSFCFTGELQMKRADAEKLVKENGGTVKSSVTKDLTYLVTNDVASGSAKNEKAKKLGVQVIDEDAFREMIH
jgi:DNA ligase (NAD+)